MNDLKSGFEIEHDRLMNDVEFTSTYKQLLLSLENSKTIKTVDARRRKAMKFIYDNTRNLHHTQIEEFRAQIIASAKIGNRNVFGNA